MEISHLNRRRAIFDPESEFDAPADIVETVGLTRGEKISALEAWEFLVTRRLASAAEGMTGHPPAPLSADAARLQEIRHALAVVRALPVPVE
jgi:hypothetical protein